MEKMKTSFKTLISNAGKSIERHSPQILLVAELPLLTIH